MGRPERRQGDPRDPGPCRPCGYAAAAAELLAPLAVNIGIEATTDAFGVSAVIEHVAVYGAKLPSTGQMIFAERAGYAIECRDLGAAGWAERRIVAAIEAATDAGVGATALYNAISMSTSTGVGLAV